MSRFFIPWTDPCSSISSNSSKTTTQDQPGWVVRSKPPSTTRTSNHDEQDEGYEKGQKSLLSPLSLSPLRLRVLLPNSFIVYMVFVLEARFQLTSPLSWGKPTRGDS